MENVQRLVECVRLTPQIAKITLNDPDNLNAMSEEMADQFRAVTSTLVGDTALCAIILTGAGRAFSAGGDLQMLKRKTTIDPASNREGMLKFYDSFLGVLRLDVPIIAAINGHAVGAGLCVACACDVRVGAQSSKFGFTFVKLGLHPGMGATFNVPRVVGMSAASELLLTGRIIDSSAALGIGLCSSIVEDDQLMPAALKIAEEIVSNGREAVMQLTRSLRAPPSSLRDALLLESANQSVNYASEEYAARIEGMLKKGKAAGR
jgi:enoyl-CoA hydratase/carnithine racemase